MIPGMINHLVYSSWRLGQDHPCVLIGHDIGGLIIKSLVAEISWSIAKKRRFTPIAVQKSIAFMRNIAGVVFYAVPESWSEIADYAKHCEKQLGMRTKGMQYFGSTEEHSFRFDDAVTANDIPMCVFQEGKPVKGLGMMVMNKYRRKCTYICEDCDHFNICNPPSQEHPSYSLLVNCLQHFRDVSEDAKLVPTASVVSECVAFSYDVLREAAHDFDDASRIGIGGFGAVYRAKLDLEGRSREVAIKKLYHKEFNEVFKGEIKRISTVRHKNIVALLGYSLPERDESLLMVTPLHSSLFKSLYENAQPWLNWQARYKMAMGVAEGLAYLHYGAPQRLVHGDIKAGNILFDSETFEAYIADFGTSKIMSTAIEETENFAGTPGYMDPHFQRYRRRSVKIDVYSFGVLLFVLVSGENARGLVEKIERKDVVDDEFWGRNDETYSSQEVRKVLWVAGQCTKYEPDDRPSMSQVVGMLKGDIPCLPYARAFSALGIYVGEFLHDIVIASVTLWYRRTTRSAFNCLVGVLTVLFIFTALKFFFRH